MKAITPRQVEVLKLRAQGHTRKEMADIVGISPKTVEGHFMALYRSSGCFDDVCLVLWALRVGLIGEETVTCAASAVKGVCVAETLPQIDCV